MKSRRTAVEHIRRLAVFLLCFFVTAALLPPAGARAEEYGKTVRTGWYDSSYNTIDAFGRRSGYAYEYQLKIGAYTGWTYEYVAGSWSELLQKLIDGEIDLMSDVSYTEERAEKMLFSDYPMGTEEYYLFIAPGNREISSSDPSTLNGKRVGANKDSIQAALFPDWARRSNVSAELVEIMTTEDESLRMLERGELDAYVTVDSFTEPERAIPVYKIGSGDFYFAVSKQRPDLLAGLNSALSRIQSEDRYYNQQLFERYIKTAGANAFLFPEEEAWLSSHGTIRVGYQDDYLAFCARDPKTGELTGALKEYLNAAAGCLQNAHLDFEAVAYPTASAAIEAMKRGETDCVFPANLSGCDSEKQGIVMSPPLIRSDFYAIVRQSDMNNFTNREHVIVAVNQGNPNYDAFLLDHYPGWHKVYYNDIEECLKAVAEGIADCVLVSSYRYNNISRFCEKHKLTTFPTGMDLDYCFAVRKGETELYSILAKAVSQIPESALNSALSYYITEDARRSLKDIISDNITAVMLAAAAVILVILMIMLRSIRAERLAKRLISATETDALTGLYNRDYFFQYANAMRGEHPDVPMDAIELNIEQFHLTNALYGREFGDHVLQTLGSGIRGVVERAGGIAGRFGADRFDIYCRHTEDYQAVFDELQHKLDDLAPNTSIRLRMGVMPWQKDLEPVQMFDRARTACNMARGHLKEPLIIFDEKLREREMFEQRLQNDLRRALDSYEFEVHYQPIYDIRDGTPQLAGAEALVRWYHPELGMIPPDDFIPLFERSGTIAELDRYVWDRAARQAARWQAITGMTIPVSVNLSRKDIFDPALEETLEGILLQNRLGHEALKLEVTESAYTENAQQLIHVVESLRGRGFTVEMDDFGTGYSSLNMLSSMPVDVLKMDRTFILDIDHDEKDIQLVALIIGTAKSLQIPVVAEGVETEAQLELLKQLGCHMVQGFYFSRPLHPSDFEAKILQEPETVFAVNRAR